jgi:hypothetical protein
MFDRVKMACRARRILLHSKTRPDGLEQRGSEARSVSTRECQERVEDRVLDNSHSAQPKRQRGSPSAQAAMSFGARLNGAYERRAPPRPTLNGAAKIRLLP